MSVLTCVPFALSHPLENKGWHGSLRVESCSFWIGALGDDSLLIALVAFNGWWICEQIVDSLWAFRVGPRMVLWGWFPPEQNGRIPRDGPRAIERDPLVCDKGG